MLDAGKLRHRVVIQSPIFSQDENTGSVNELWDTVATVWAAIEPLSGKELIAAQAVNSKITGRIRIRYRPNLNTAMRLYHPSSGWYYNIEAILSDKDSGLEYLTLPVSEGIRVYMEEDFVTFNGDSVTSEGQQVVFVN